jgi:hypothetical protein
MKIMVAKLILFVCELAFLCFVLLILLVLGVVDLPGVIVNWAARTADVGE